MNESLIEKIQNDIKEAMKARDNLKRDCLRTAVSEIKNQTVNAGKPITDEIVVKVLQKSVKTHNDSISQFESAGREDLAEKEKRELKILSDYLPKMLSEEIVQTIILQIINDNKIDEVKKNTGLVMKLLAKHPERPLIDMKVASSYLGYLMK